MGLFGRACRECAALREQLKAVRGDAARKARQAAIYEGRLGGLEEVVEILREELRALAAIRHEPAPTPAEEPVVEGGGFAKAGAIARAELEDEDEWKPPDSMKIMEQIDEVYGDAWQPDVSEDQPPPGDIFAFADADPEEAEAQEK